MRRAGGSGIRPGGIGAAGGAVVVRGLWVGAGEHQRDAHLNSVAAPLVTLLGLLLAIAGGVFAGVVDGLGEGRENFDFGDVLRGGLAFGDLFDVGGEKVSGTLIVALAEDEGVVECGVVERSLIGVEARGAEQRKRCQRRCEYAGA